MPDADAGTTAPPTLHSIDMDLSTKQENKPDSDPRQGLPASVNVQEANTPFVPDATKRKDPSGKYVQYNGVGTVRIMGPAEWAAANVPSDDYHEWNYLNHKRIPLSSFSDEQLQYLLRVDDRFEVVTIDSEGDKVEDETTE